MNWQRIRVQLSRLWELINQPPLRTNRPGAAGYPLLRLVGRYFISPHGLRLTIMVVLVSIVGVRMFAYAGAMGFAADQILEVGLQADAPTEATGSVSVGPERSGDLGPLEDSELAEANLRGDAAGLGSLVDREQATLEAHGGPRPGKSVGEKLWLLGWLAVILIGMEIIRLTMDAVAVQQRIKVSQSAQFRLRQALHDKLHALPLHYHDDHSPGRLMTHLFSDVNVIGMQVIRLVQGVPPQIATLIMGVAILLYVDAKLAVLVLVALPLYAVCYRWFRKRLKTVNINLREREGMLNALIANRISNFQVVKSFRRETGESINFLREAKPIIQGHLASSILSTGFVVVCALVTGTCVTMVLVLAALRARDGLMTPGQVWLFYMSAAQLFSPVASLTNQATLLHRLRAVAGKIMRVLDEPITLGDPQIPLPLPSQAPQIRLDSVSFSYADNRAPALDDVNFTLPAGKRLCVMGPSGSGKSTLAKLVARLYDPTVGSIQFDGADVRNFNIREFRRLIGFVPQEPIVFSGTIGNNIRYGNEQAEPRAVVEAARYAQIHDFIQQLPERYSTLTHERGLTLSGGQKQRVNLARVLLHDPQVIVLDDCTSALDAETEAKLVDGFDDVLHGRTSIIATHRVSIAMRSDYVLMMDGGRVVEFGPASELLDADGPFAQLYHEQIDRGADAEQHDSEFVFSGVAS